MYTKDIIRVSHAKKKKKSTFLAETEGKREEATGAGRVEVWKWTRAEEDSE